MRTSKHLMLTVAMLIGISALAQEEDEPRYLFTEKTGKIELSGFGSPIVGFCNAEDEFGVMVGGGGALLINQNYYVGGYGMGLATRNKRDPFTIRDNNQNIEITNRVTEFGHGGLWLGYIHDYKKLVHFGFSTKIGGGAVSLVDEDYDYQDAEDDIGWDVVFVLTPELQVEVNLMRWFKLNLGAGYQFVSGINNTYQTPEGEEVMFFDKNDFNSPVFNISLMVGSFQ
ncbi:MAG: hypothetical protein K9I94_12360 [Bacteroidales bacterium]|nr:hypothetical protein [Bacteroidales bacterium]